VLNVGDLEALLASGNVTVTTAGSGVQAKDILVRGSFSWASSSFLALDAYRSISVDEAVSITGQSGLSLRTNDGGAGGWLSFDNKGHVSFANLTSTLSVNGANYILVNSIAKLAKAVGGNPMGDFALAKSYDAGKDGTYASSPVGYFDGFFEGLGNQISNLTISDSTQRDFVGLFTLTYGTIENVRLTDVSVTGGQFAIVGGLTGESRGSLLGDSVSGSVTSPNGNIVGGLIGFNHPGGVIRRCHSGTFVSSVGDTGGLAGDNFGTVTMSYATGTVQGTRNSVQPVGGLVGFNNHPINTSFATGSVSAGDYSYVGGLTGETAAGSITNSYATGAVAGGQNSSAGGLVGYLDPDGSTTESYSSGAVTADTGSFIGGLIGIDDSSGGIVRTYWDTTTSGITNPGQGAGNIANDPGIKGLTDKKLRSGLPKGLSRKFWAESAGINNGLPYLSANPPPN
jgi:hypothetical protein